MELETDKPFVILIQHPVTWETNQSRNQINETLKALRKIKYKL